MKIIALDDLLEMISFDSIILCLRSLGNSVSRSVERVATATLFHLPSQKINHSVVAQSFVSNDKQMAH